MKDARLELRIEKRLLDRIDAARGDVSRTRWVERALERALNPPTIEQTAERALESALGDVAPDSRGAEGGGRLPSSSASTRAPRGHEGYQSRQLPPGVKSARELAMERQRKMNERKS